MANEPQASASGAEKAAILLMSLGEKAAAEVLKHMGPKEVQKIGLAMANMHNVTKPTVDGILADFIDTVKNETAISVGAEDYIRNVLVNALGEDKASSIIDRILLGGHTKGLESLKWMDARAVVDLIRHEHPQIIAIVLSYLDSDHAADVLSAFPEKVRSDVLLRIASIEGVQPAAMQELNEMLEQQLRGGSAVQQSAIGGIKAAANILNFVDSGIEGKIMEQIKDVDADLGQKIEDLMFVFENLIEIDDRGIQVLLREISTDVLVLALKGTDDSVKEKIFKNMSKRAAEMLRDDLDSKGPVRLSEVEAAQKEILQIARRLADEGQIVLAGSSEEMV